MHPHLRLITSLLQMVMALLLGTENRFDGHCGGLQELGLSIDL